MATDPRYDEMRRALKGSVAAAQGGDALVNPAMDEIASLEAEAAKPKTQEQLDAETLQKRFEEGSKESQADISAKTLEGTDSAAAGLLPSETDMKRQAGTLGMSMDPALSSALQRRSSSIYDRAQHELGRAANLRAPDVSFKRAVENRQIKTAENAVQQERYRQAYQKYVDEKKARAGILGTLLSIGGTILGGMLTGGASVVAQGVGKAVGGAGGSAAAGALSGNNYAQPANQMFGVGTGE